MSIAAVGPAFDPACWRRRLAVALGQAPADLLLAGGTVLDIHTGELRRADVAIVDGVIARVGDPVTATHVHDVTGLIVAPSFIDAHIHIESSHLWPTEFARAVLPHGTGAVVADAHEIANVAGVPGLEAFRAAAVELPLHIRWTIPSCVPASPLESPGATLEAADIAPLLAWPESGALGELMNVPGVLAGDDAIAAKLAASAGMIRDGHAPALRGHALQAYVGSGITSDHESTTAAEALEKLRAGMMVVIRQGSSEHNLHDLLPIVTPLTAHRCAFGSDDRGPHDLLASGHIDATLRLAIAEGLDPALAYRMATWNPAQHWRFPGIGAVVPGYEANLVLLADLHRVEVAATLFRGEIVAEHGRCLAPIPPVAAPEVLRHSVNVAPVLGRNLRLDPASATRAVVAIPGQIVTGLAAVDPKIVAGAAVSDPARDLLKIVCVERHHATGRVGVGYVRGFGLKRGAMATTIAHDAHNILAVGVDDADILGAIAVVGESQGGLAVVADGRVEAHLELPIAGLLSELSADETATAYDACEAAARALGSALPSPFGLLAFMALSVIPAARVTDRGLITVDF